MFGGFFLQRNPPNTETHIPNKQNPSHLPSLGAPAESTLPPTGFRPVGQPHTSPDLLVSGADTASEVLAQPRRTLTGSRPAGGVLSAGDTWHLPGQMSEGASGRHSWGCYSHVAGRAGGTAQAPTMQGAAPATKNCLAQNVRPPLKNPALPWKIYEGRGCSLNKTPFF